MSRNFINDFYRSPFCRSVRNNSKYKITLTSTGVAISKICRENSQSPDSSLTLSLAIHEDVVFFGGVALDDYYEDPFKPTNEEVDILMQSITFREKDFWLESYKEFFIPVLNDA